MQSYRRTDGYRKKRLFPIFPPHTHNGVTEAIGLSVARVLSLFAAIEEGGRKKALKMDRERSLLSHLRACIVACATSNRTFALVEYAMGVLLEEEIVVRLTVGFTSGGNLSLAKHGIFWLKVDLSSE